MTKRREKPAKRQRVKREPRIHRERLFPARVFRVHPNPYAPFIVEVRLARDRRRMREAISYMGDPATAASLGRDVMGMVRSWECKRTRRAGIMKSRGLVARMFLNVVDLRNHPSTIVPHECGHAAMAWGRTRGVSVRSAMHSMDHEEIICYAVGDLVRQINQVCFAAGVWP